MEEEIDLREYVEVLIRWRWWIMGLALMAAVVALGVSFLLPSQYEATALATATQPRYVMRFDPRFEPSFETISQVQPAYKAYLDLATGDELLLELFTQLNPLPEDVETLGDLRDLVEAESGADPSIVRLTVRSRDPEETARAANAWVKLFMIRANEIYGAQNEEYVRFFEDQLEQAGVELEAAEQALAAFQARNQESILGAQLASARRDQVDYLAEQRTLERLLQDVKELRAQLAARAGEAEVTLGDELTVLQLRFRALDSASAQEPGLVDVIAAAGIQLRVEGAGTLAGRTTAELVALLDALEQGLESKGQEVEARLAALEPQILALQQKVQETSNEADRLNRAQDVARETYMTLARKVDETRIAAQDTSGKVRLVSQAAVPEEPVSPRKRLNTAVAGALGLMIGVFGAFAIEWWRGGKAVDSTQ